MKKIKSQNFALYFSRRFAGLLLAFLFVFQIAPAVPAAAAAPGGRYIIKLVSGASPEILSGLGGNLSRRFAFSGNKNFKNIYTFSSGYSLSDLRAALAGKFDYLENDGELSSADISVQQLISPNDPGFTANSLDVDKQWGLAKAQFIQAWTRSTGSAKNVVAVIDTGVDATHEDLQNINWIDGFNFVSNQPISGHVNSDDNGHGTLVAGVLGATANNNMGITGANWQISIMPIKALAADGKGDAAAVAEAIIWAADHGAAITNLSVGGVGFGHDTTLANAISYAFNRGVLLVAAAGNDVAVTGGSLDSEPVYPICDDNNANMIIGVAATDQNDLKPAFSNYGKNCIDVSAPGKRILSTINYDPLTKKYAPDSYAYASGTSLAVPFVAAEAALIKALNPGAGNAQIRDQIVATTDYIDDINTTQCAGQSCRGMLGSGRINAFKSLTSVITPVAMEGDLVKTSDTNLIYLISGGQRHLVSPFVMNQRFFGAVPKGVSSSQIGSFPEGYYALPAEGTLVKLDADPTVYYISNGQKLPVTAAVFSQRGLAFSQVDTVSYPELTSWATGNFLSPVDGSLLRTVKNKTVYWVVGGVLHPVNYGFYIDKGLNIFPVLYMPDTDINGFAKGEAFIK